MGHKLGNRGASPPTKMEGDAVIPEFTTGMGDFPFSRGDNEYQAKMSKAEFRVLRQGGTEAYGRGEYGSFFPKTGYFACRACNLPLYSAGSKFQGCGWDAYDKCFYTGERCHVLGRGPKSHLEAVCAGCGSHLGHTFFGERHTDTNERH